MLPSSGINLDSGTSSEGQELWIAVSLTLLAMTGTWILRFTQNDDTKRIKL